MTAHLNGRRDDLSVRLHQAAEHQMLAARPAWEVRRHAERARNRRRMLAASAGVVAAVSTGVTFQQLGAPHGLFSTTVFAERPKPAPTPPPTTAEVPARPPATTAPPSATPSPTPTPSATEQTRTPTQVPSSVGWPAPPTGRPTGDRWAPWARPGADFGYVVAARMEDGHAVLTFDRVQLFTRSQWTAQTGLAADQNFVAVNESTRTRQFVVEDDAKLYGGPRIDDHAERPPHSAGEFVRRINEELVEQTVESRATAAGQERPAGLEVPRLEFFVFHRDGLDGPVAYAEEAAVTTAARTLP